MADPDTIAAIATPPGNGGIGIVRVSGPDTEAIANKILGKLPEPRLATLARFCTEDGSLVDSGIALYFPGPDSFTGESVLELHGHGGSVVQSLLMEALLASGARRAEPGEFSRRAFENDKLDLAQAEAIADLIASGSAQAARAALRSLAGDFSNAVHALVEMLTRIRMYVEAAIDFPDEDIDFLSDDKLTTQLRSCAADFEELTRNAESGRVLRDGFRVVIAGRPNAGKSSLMNRLSGDDTAIVTDVAGTTRDVLRETINVDGLLVELVDTAGLREQPDVIEEEGIRRARKAMQSADAILWIHDDATSLSESDLPDDQDVLVVRNKIDVSGAPAGERDGAVFVSADTGDGLDELKQALLHLAGFGQQGEGSFTARQRHVDALYRAREHFDRGRQALDDALAGELLAEELRLAQECLSEITGSFSSDDLLGRIFADFCIGK